MKRSKLEARFDLLWKCLRGFPLEKEVKFHPDRKWRFDRACKKRMVAFECEGGIWIGGAHTRGAHYVSDCEKYNEAALLGWRVIRLTDKHLTLQYLGHIMEGVLCPHGNR